MRTILLVGLAISAASAAAGAPKEASVTPWFAYGASISGVACPDDDWYPESSVGSDDADQNMSAGVEVIVLWSSGAGVLASVDRFVVGEWCGSREAEVTSASAGVLLMTDRTGRVRWDQGLSYGVIWPDPWGGRSANFLARWRIASAIQVQRYVAVELAVGLQFDTGDFHGLRGPLGRIGLRLGPRVTN